MSCHEGSGKSPVSVPKYLLSEWNEPWERPGVDKHQWDVFPNDPDSVPPDPEAMPIGTVRRIYHGKKDPRVNSDKRKWLTTRNSKVLKKLVRKVVQSFLGQFEDQESNGTHGDGMAEIVNDEFSDISQTAELLSGPMYRGGFELNSRSNRMAYGKLELVFTAALGLSPDIAYLLVWQKLYQILGTAEQGEAQEKIQDFFKNIKDLFDRINGSWTIPACLQQVPFVDDGVHCPEIAREFMSN